MLLIFPYPFSVFFAEEEIDVVSVGDKNLPTNPSAKDRRALQTTVAHKISAGIVKTTGKSIHRRPSNTSSDSSGYSSKLNSTYTHQYFADTIQTINNSQQLSLSNTTAATTTFITGTPVNGSRKRAANPKTLVATLTPGNTNNNNLIASKRSKLNGSSSSSSSSSDCIVSSSKKLVNGQISRSIANGVTSTPNSNTSSPMSTPKRSTNDLDDSDSVEKRNLHNDMERQRRIGLKNLFENLKEKIPSLRDKERAPKVNILREATMLCKKMTKDEAEFETLKRKNQRLQQRLKQLKASMHTIRA